MTAEIAILNKRGVALAADSAVTATFDGGIKVFPSANKLFALSKYHPVGIMIYSSAEMMGLPWETTVKTYRRELSNESFPALSDYASSFLSFLETHKGLYPDNEKERFILQELFSAFSGIKETFIEQYQEALTGNLPYPEDPKTMLSVIIEVNVEAAKARPRFQHVDGNQWSDEMVRDVEKRHLPIIRKYRDKVFEDFTLDRNQKKLLTEFGKMVLTRTVGATGYTGLVIAGFGDDEYFPVLSAFEVYGNLDGKLRYIKGKGVRIGIDSGAAIMPFAQSEMVKTFMTGVDPSYQATVLRATRASIYAANSTILHHSQPDLAEDDGRRLIEAIVDEVSSELSKTLGEESWHSFVEPILSVVEALPKTELASMAESLVNLTSMKRHVSSVSETVGGPIDVALISKGDGFVWIKRKHYFDRNLNHHFFANYFHEGGKSYEG